MSDKPEYINMAEIVDPDDPQGRTYRQVNQEKQHNIPVGSLVEIGHPDDKYNDDLNGLRLWVVWHGRDCDGTPLYWLSADKEDTKKENGIFANRGWTGGYGENSLTVVEPFKERV